MAKSYSEIEPFGKGGRRRLAVLLPPLTSSVRLGPTCRFPAQHLRQSSVALRHPPLLGDDIPEAFPSFFPPLRIRLPVQAPKAELLCEFGPGQTVPRGASLCRKDAPIHAQL